MIIKKEITNLHTFNFWSNAESNAKAFTIEELENIFDVLSDMSEEQSIDETALNDLFWFEPDVLCEWIGLDFLEYEARL